MGNEFFLISTFIFALFTGKVANSENASKRAASSYKVQNLNICDDENKTSYIRGTVTGRLSTPQLPPDDKFCHHDFEFPPSLNFVFDFEEIFLGTEATEGGRGKRGCNDQDHVHIVSHNGSYQSLGFYCASRKDWDRCVQVPPGSSWVQIQFYAKNKSLAGDQNEARKRNSPSPPSSFKISFQVADESVCPSPFILTDLLVWGGAAGGALFCFLILPCAFFCRKKTKTKDVKQPLEYLSSRPLDASVFESHIHQLDFQGRHTDADASIATINTTVPLFGGDIPVSTQATTTLDRASTPESSASPLSLPVRVHPTPSGRRQIIQSELTDDSDLPIFFTKLAALKTDAQQQRQRGGVENGISLSTFGSGRRKESDRPATIEGREYASTSDANEYADPGSVFKRNTYEEARRSFLHHKALAPAPSSPAVYTLPTNTSLATTMTTEKENSRQPSMKESPSEYIARRPEEEYNSPWHETRENLDAIMPDLVPTEGSAKWHTVAPGSMSDLVANSAPEDERTSLKNKETGEKNTDDKKLETKKKIKGKDGETEDEDEEKKKAKKKKKKREKEEKRKAKQSKEEQKSEGKKDTSSEQTNTGKRTSSIAAEPALEFKSINENIFMKQNAMKK